MGEVYTRFQAEMAQKPYPLGQHIPIWLIEESIPRWIVYFRGFTDLVYIYFLPVPTATESTIPLAFLAQASLPHCRLKIVNNIWIEIRILYFRLKEAKRFIRGLIKTEVLTSREASCTKFCAGMKVAQASRILRLSHAFLHTESFRFVCKSGVNYRRTNRRQDIF